MVLGQPEGRQRGPPLGIALGYRYFEAVINVGPAGGRVQELVRRSPASARICKNGHRRHDSIEVI